MNTTLEAIHMIVGERFRQIYHHSYTSDIDDKYVEQQLLQASTAYLQSANESICNSDAATAWPIDWDKELFKPSEDQIRNLTKGLALGLAELERLLRKK